MAKFCGKCGARLDAETGLCPRCDAEKTKRKIKEKCKAEKKAVKKEQKFKKKAKKKEKRANLTTGQKICRVFLKSFLWLILLVVVAGGVTITLSYIGIVDIPILSEFNEDSILEALNERTTTVEEKDVVMKTDTEGTAVVIVKMPNYELLFKKAYASENPDKYLIKALLLGDYEIREYKEVATVTVVNDVVAVHSDEVVHKLLEKALINAINALSEVE